MRRPWVPIYVKIKGKRVCKIPLTRGFFALIDAKYLSTVMLYAWSAWTLKRTTRTMLLRIPERRMAVGVTCDCTS